MLRSFPILRKTYSAAVPAAGRDTQPILGLYKFSVYLYRTIHLNKISICRPAPFVKIGSGAEPVLADDCDEGAAPDPGAGGGVRVKVVDGPAAGVGTIEGGPGGPVG